MFKQALMCGVLCGAIGCSADDVKERAVVTATLGRLDPMFAAYVRVDGSEWSVVSDSDFNAGVVSFGVQFDRYLTVAVRCSGEHTPTYVIERSIARGDSPTLNFPCKTLPATRHRVTGQLASAGIVGLGTAIVDSVDVFELEVPAGTYDLVASTELSLYYQPDLVVTDDLALPEIDVDAQGAPLSRFAVRVPDELDGWRASTRTRLRTPNGTAFALGGENGPDVVVPSPEVRDQGVEVDSYVEVSRSSNGVQQSIRAPRL